MRIPPAITISFFPFSTHILKVYDKGNSMVKLANWLHWKSHLAGQSYCNINFSFATSNYTVQTTCCASFVYPHISSECSKILVCSSYTWWYFFSFFYNWPFSLHLLSPFSLHPKLTRFFIKNKINNHLFSHIF
jgi:hypothetical protein